MARGGWRGCWSLVGMRVWWDLGWVVQDWSWLDLAKPELWISIALVSASNLAILSTVAWSNPA